MTLLEMMVALAIVAGLTVGLGSITYSVLHHTKNNNAHVTAASNTEQAARSIAEDGQMAQTTDLIAGAAPVSSVTLNWIDPVNGDSHVVVYSLSGNNLQRSDSLNGGAPTVSTVARHVVSVGFYQPANNARLIEVTFTAAGISTSVNEVRKYYVMLRAVG